MVNRTQACKHCGEGLTVGTEVTYEGYTGDYFCDSNCYRKFIQENIEDYFSYIEYVMNVGVTTL